MSGVTISRLRKYFAPRDIDEQKSIKGKGAINGLDLEIREGEFFVLLGPSGCGKTTTLRCVAGLETPDAGSITIGGQVVAAPAERIAVLPNKRSIGMVFQSYALWPHMSVFDNVAYPLKQRQKSLGRADAEREVRAALELVGLENLGQRSPSDLSGGQQQRVALARAVVAKPDLLLFDEPLSNLDAQLRVRLRSDLRRVHDSVGHTSIFVTHDQSEALALADRVAVMKEGGIAQLGTPEEIFQSPNSAFVAEFVGFDNFLRGRVRLSNADELLFEPDGWDEPLVARANPQLRAGDRAQVAFRSAGLRIATNSVIEATNKLRERL
ncbi:MAG: ABC transporter ATP-binding protein, partial [Spongiibacteraceae bacterium]|nr:ABC transporter ATP-binding protein [Spongiibacteraceae bacterium]